MFRFLMMWWSSLLAVICVLFYCLSGVLIMTVAVGWICLRGFGFGGAIILL
jgi:hypothetical protein